MLLAIALLVLAAVLLFGGRSRGSSRLTGEPLVPLPREYCHHDQPCWCGRPKDPNFNYEWTL